MKFFISGPMTGLPDLNVQAFAEARAKIEIAGHTSIDPVRLIGPDLKDIKWTPEIYKDILYGMLDTIMYDGVEAMMMLNGWAKSKGARAEFAVAEAIGLPIYSDFEELR